MSKRYWQVLGAFMLVMGSLSPTLANAAEAPVAGATANGSPEYLIGPGDQLRIFVWRNADLSATVPVRPDGKISTPLVEDMGAVGKTPSQLARDIEQVLADYIRSPSVNVIVEQSVGALAEQIRVVGQAVTPKGLPYRDQMTLLDVMIEVGGLTPFAAGNRAKLVRKLEDGSTREYPVRLKDLLERGDVSRNMEVRPGDVIIIPESFF